MIPPRPPNKSYKNNSPKYRQDMNYLPNSSYSMQCPLRSAIKIDYVSVTTDPENKPKCPYGFTAKPKSPCNALYHDYIKCIYTDDECCAHLYEKYMKCLNK